MVASRSNHDRRIMSKNQGVYTALKSAVSTMSQQFCRRLQVAAANPIVYPREFILSKSLSLRKVAQMVQGSLNSGNLLLGQNFCLGDKDFAKNSLGHKKRFKRQG